MKIHRLLILTVAAMLTSSSAFAQNFYDDDIYQFMKQGNEADATRALVDKVCNGGSDA